MDIAAKLSSKGQITVPKPVREILKLRPGDRVLFRVERDHAILARTEDFLDLAGTVAVPPGKKGASWEQVRRQTRRARAKDRS